MTQPTPAPPPPTAEQLILAQLRTVSRLLGWLVLFTAILAGLALAGAFGYIELRFEPTRGF